MVHVCKLLLNLAPEDASLFLGAVEFLAREVINGCNVYHSK